MLRHPLQPWAPPGAGSSVQGSPGISGAIADLLHSLGSPTVPGTTPPVGRGGAMRAQAIDDTVSRMQNAPSVRAY